jgi:leucyl aminopeptidase
MEFKAQVGKGAIAVLFIEGGLNRYDGNTLWVGYGKTKPLTRRKFVTLMRKIVAGAKIHSVTSLSINFKDIRSFAPKDMSDEELGEIAGTAFVMADYVHNTYKTEPKNGWTYVKTLTVVSASKEAQKGLAKGKIIATEVNATRELSNTPGGVMTPKVLAQAAKVAAKGTKIKVTVLGRAHMQKLGMGGVLGVGRGAEDEPQFIIMEYKGGPASQKPLVFAGKGVTFDTGGQQVKSGDHMYEMHMDMSGGAAVIHAIALAAKLKIKANIVALVPAVENATGPGAIRPGDMLKSLSGKTIEVLHTDAEGRIILADAITYAKRFKPAAVVDVATLTGAALVALGVHASGVMGNDEKFIETLRELGEDSGDYIWPFPLWEEYDDMVKGHFGDVPNISTAGNSRYGGVIAGGKFLEVFAKELNCPWAHLDIAPRMTSAPGDFLAKGATGVPVRLLLKLAEHHANRSNR